MTDLWTSLLVVALAWSVTVWLVRRGRAGADRQQEDQKYLRSLNEALGKRERRKWWELED